MDALRGIVGRALERGSLGALRGPAGAAIDLAARAWAAAASARLARPLELPAGARVIGVGGATLGGAGKAPVAVALARALAAQGGRVALVAHAYRAAPSRARAVAPDDAAAVVGDDALAAARKLAADGIPVFVGPTRQAALALAAASGARTIVVDGLLQASPRRLAASVLVLDAEAPWGAGACPPLGDLRAPLEALLAAADHLAVVRDAGSALDATTPAGAIELASDLAGLVDARGERRELASLAGARLGLLVAIARPERVVRALARRGLEPAVVVALGDHARLGPGAAARLDPRVDAWLTTLRCATKLPAAVAGRPVLALDHRVDASGLVRALDGLRGGYGSPGPLC